MLLDGYLLTKLLILLNLNKWIGQINEILVLINKLVACWRLIKRGHNELSFDVYALIGRLVIEIESWVVDHYKRLQLVLVILELDAARLLILLVFNQLVVVPVLEF